MRLYLTAYSLILWITSLLFTIAAPLYISKRQVGADFDAHPNSPKGQCHPYTISLQNEARLKMNWKVISSSWAPRWLEEDTDFEIRKVIDGQMIQFVVAYISMNGVKGEYGIRMKNYIVNSNRKQVFHHYRISWESKGQAPVHYWLDSDWDCTAFHIFSDRELDAEGQVVI